MELAEEEQKRIKAEEIYRAEVQRQLKPPVPQRRLERLVTFLNTPLGLWVLSSLVLAGLVAVYTNVQASVAGQRQKHLKIDQINSQLAVRLDYALSLLKKAHSANGEAVPNDATKETYLIVLRTFLDDDPETRLSPDFKDRSTLSLIYELKSLDESHFPQTGQHSYDTLIGYVGDLIQVRQGLVSDSFSRLNDKDRVGLWNTVDTTMNKIDQQ